MSSNVPNSSTLDGLPKQFVSAMRTLFDIMDDKSTGYVNFQDIEARWQDDGSKGLPKGVLESLRKVTPANNLLSFERFCAGLKICLLRNQVDKRTGNVVSNGSNNVNRPPSAPLLDLDNSKTYSSGNTVAVRPNLLSISSQRTLSMPQLVKSDENEALVKPPIYGPPKPPRTALITGSGNVTFNSNIDRNEIRNALQNWQLGLLMNENRDNGVNSGANVNHVRLGVNRSMGDGKATDLNSPLSPLSPLNTSSNAQIYQKKNNVRRREPRRHTLQNGIDYNMLKRIKQIEQEKDMLMMGLSAVEKARDWYLKQVGNVQERMKYLGRNGHVEPFSEAQQERLELQRARVLEVNRHLEALTNSWERGGLPLHMNLAVQPQPHLDLSVRLKQQNHLLTEEVSKKSERISILEREKASLIRELLQIRAGNLQIRTEEGAVF